MINVSNLTKTFGSFKALDGLTINVPEGSVYGLVGPNGAGKTTVIKHIAGVYRQDSGYVKVGGEEVYENFALKQKMFFVSDDLYFFPTYSILDTAKFYAGIYENWSWERFESLKKVFEIDVKRSVRKLSKGMQKQAAFWIGISCMPNVMILDEPVDGLDPIMRRAVWRLIMQDVAERGMTVLVSSHNLRELEDVCDCVGIMHNGKIVLEKSLDDMKGSVHKIQLAMRGGEIPAELESGLEILSKEKFGSVTMLIVRGDAEEISEKIKAFSPIIFDMLSLTLEEVFIYELGGMGYELENIII